MARNNEEKDVVALYYESINRFGNIPETEERELIKKAQAGDIDARNKVVQTHLRFVANCAKRFARSDMSILDLISEGNLGLIEAIYHFDVEAKNKFITYAVNWINQAMIKYLQDNSRTIRIPVNRSNEVRKIKEKIIEAEENNSKVELKKIAEELGLDSETCRNLLAICSPMASLDTQISSDGNKSISIGDMIESTYPSAEELIEKDETKKYVRKMVATLPERERKIIMMRYGIGEYTEMSLEDIGQILNITKERVRQLENDAIAMLREKMVV